MRYWPFCLLIGALLSCQNERDDVTFDPADSFVRFNFGNTAVDPALDTLTLEPDADTVLIPVALSSPPRPDALTFDYAVRATNATLGEHFALSPDRLALPPGDFDDTLTFLVLATPPDRPAAVTLELTASSDPTLSLGFPGPTARGRTFTLVWE